MRSHLLIVGLNVYAIDFAVLFRKSFICANEFKCIPHIFLSYSIYLVSCCSHRSVWNCILCIYIWHIYIHSTYSYKFWLVSFLRWCLPLVFLGLFDKIQMSICVWNCDWIFNSIPLINVSVYKSIICCFYYYSSAMQFGIWDVIPIIICRSDHYNTSNNSFIT